MHKSLAACLLLLCGTGVVAQSPYADEQGRQIKALSTERIAGLKAGRGLGYAKAAELNGYPGPKHVLELADELDLDADQLRRTEALHETMLESAGALGRELVAVEAELEETFAEASMSRKHLVELVSRSSRIEGRIRLIHLQAHLEQLELLDDEQVTKYMRLRGYGQKASEDHHQHRH